MNIQAQWVFTDVKDTATCCMFKYILHLTQKTTEAQMEMFFALIAC